MSAEILNDFTKQEIIDWVRAQPFFLKVKRSDLLFARWSAESYKLQADYQKEFDDWDANKPDFKERDRLAQQLNASTDLHERLRLLEKMEPYDAALTAHFARIEALDARQKKLDALYRKLEKTKD